MNSSATRLRPGPAVPNPRLRLNVGMLALPGGTQAQAGRIGAALQAELARLLAAADVNSLASSQVPQRLDAGTLRFETGERPEIAGRRLARAIAAALLSPQAFAGRREVEK
jgi:hypothetical protein